MGKQVFPDMNRMQLKLSLKQFIKRMKSKIQDR